MNDIKFRGAGVGATSYIRILSSGSLVWSTSGGTGGFESFNSANWLSYAISAVEQGSTNVFVASVPSALPGGVYDIDARNQIGGAAAVTDPGVAQGDLQWNGTEVIPLVNLATSGQVATIGPIRVARGVMITNWMIYLKSASDHVTPFTSGVVSGQISRDGAALGAFQSGAFTEVGNGFYKLQAITSGDILCNTAAMLFTATGISGGTSDPLPMTLVTQKVSGSV